MKLFLFLFSLPVFFTQAIFADNSVAWQSIKTLANSDPDRVSAEITGQTSIGTQIRIAGDEVIFFSESDDFKTESAKKVFNQEVAFADSQGIFKIMLSLPLLNAQIPFEIKFPDGTSKIYQLNLSVKKEAVKISNEPDVKVEIEQPQAWMLWLGLGMNSFLYNQTTTIPSNLEINQFGFSNLYFQISKQLNENWLLDSYLNYSYGNSSSNTNAQLVNSQFKWLSVELSAAYTKPNWTIQVNQSQAQLSLITGLVYTLHPFVSRTSPTNAIEAEIKSNSLILAVVGGGMKFDLNAGWKIESFLSYLYPLSSDGGYKLSPQFSFEASVGATQLFFEKYKMGIFVNHQNLNFDFNNLSDVYSANNGGTKVDGAQKISITNLNFRMGYGF